MFFKILKLAALFTLSLMAYTSAAPVNTMCTTTTSTDLYAYCSKTTTISDDDLQELYVESDDIFDTLADELCKITVSIFYSL